MLQVDFFQDLKHIIQSYHLRIIQLINYCSGLSSLAAIKADSNLPGVPTSFGQEFSQKSWNFAKEQKLVEFNFANISEFQLNLLGQLVNVALTQIDVKAKDCWSTFQLPWHQYRIWEKWYRLCSVFQSGWPQFFHHGDHRQLRIRQCSRASSSLSRSEQQPWSKV